MLKYPVEPTIAEIRAKLHFEDLGDWIEPWTASQGGRERAARFQRVAASIAFDPSQAIDVLDLCAGPGDLGRAVLERFPRARVDALDRSRLLLALCAESYQRSGHSVRIVEADLWDVDWTKYVRERYDVVVAATALHWFDELRLSELMAEVRARLRIPGMFVFSEPFQAEGISAGSGEASPEAWRLRGENWETFWRHAETVLGSDPRQALKACPKGRSCIGDDALPIERYLEIEHVCLDRIANDARVLRLAIQAGDRRPGLALVGGAIHRVRLYR